MKKAYRTRTAIFYPLYVNAEMLVLEFFKGKSINITPLEATEDDMGGIKINEHIDVLDQLIIYINSNL